MPTGCIIKKDDASDNLYGVFCLNCGNRVWYATGSSLKAAKKRAEETMTIAKIANCDKCGSSLESEDALDG